MNLSSAFRRFRRRSTALGILLMIGLAAPLGAAPAYRVIDLGTFPRGKSSEALAINDQGWIVGYAETAAGERRPVLWRDGQMIDLAASLSPRGTGTADALNNRGQIVGATTFRSGDSRAFLWEEGILRDLGTLGTGYSSARAINDLGQVVGISSAPVEHGTELHGFLWDGGPMSDIASPSRGSYDFPNAINAKGQIVGYAVVEERAIVWAEGEIRHLPVSPEAVKSNAYSINAVGQIAGGIQERRMRAVVWENGAFRKLGALDDADYSWAFGINNKGQAVGWSRIRDGVGWIRAVLWENGVTIDLGKPGHLETAPGLGESWAYDINERGEIVGGAITADGERRAVLFQPVSAPGR
jgi:probable HAF family extracellular repeat protein